MNHPYASQPDRAFWKKAISPHNPLDVTDWYQRKFPLDGGKIATAGSCFAQHIGRRLRAEGFQYLDMEPPPPGLPQPLWADYGYGMFSARYGNVYTARQLVQLVQRALGSFRPVETHWEKAGGVVDPFRPTLEREPFGSVAELQALQADHLERVVELLGKTDVFVFTLGLTEAWVSRQDGAVFPLCPGTSAGGVFDPERHGFVNLGVGAVRADMDQFIALARKINPALKLLLTVSPVPLMATATNSHVAVASSHSKAVLRAVAGELAADLPFVDYFPSYEIISAPFMKGFFFQPDGREVSPHGVAHVMHIFFGQHPPPPAGPAPALEFDGVAELDQLKCDEELLNAFSQR